MIIQKTKENVSSHVMYEKIIIYTTIFIHLSCMYRKTRCKFKNSMKNIAETHTSLATKIHLYVHAILTQREKQRCRERLTSLTKNRPCLSGYTKAKDSFAFLLLAAGATSLTCRKSQNNNQD